MVATSRVEGGGVGGVEPEPDMDCTSGPIKKGCNPCQFVVVQPCSWKIEQLVRFKKGGNSEFGHCIKL